MRNRIVTRGMGTQQLLVTRGYGGAFVERVIAVIERFIINRHGRRHRDEWEELTVFARMIEVDNKEAPRGISGEVTVKVKRGSYQRSLAKLISNKIKEWATTVTRVIR